MNKADRDSLAKRVIKFYTTKANKDIIATCHHFMAEGIARNTIKAAINRYVKYGSSETKSPPGRIAKVGNIKVRNKIKQIIKRNPNLSVREGARKVKISKSAFHNIKLHKLGIKAYKKQTVPKYASDQEQRAKKACKKLHKRICNESNKIILIIDDETYVPQDPQQIPGTQYYHCEEKSDVPFNNRFKTKQKFFKKFLIWSAIDECGNVCEPFISTGTMNGEIYLKECWKISCFHLFKNIMKDLKSYCGWIWQVHIIIKMLLNGYIRTILNLLKKLKMLQMYLK